MINNSKLTTLEANANRYLLFDSIANAVNNCIGFSLVRLGDGELRVFSEDYYTSTDLYEQLFSYQFGSTVEELTARFNTTIFDDAIKCAVGEIRQSLIKQIQQADFVGTTCEFTIDDSQINVNSALPAFKYGTSISRHFINPNATLVSTYIFTNDYNFTKDFFYKLSFLKFKNIYFFGSADNAVEILSTIFNMNVLYVKTPSHSTYGHDKPTPYKAYPHFYDSINSDCFQIESGSLVLSSCGLVGKTLANSIKRQGSIFIDIGALVDGWVGSGLPYICSQPHFFFRKA